MLSHWEKVTIRLTDYPGEAGALKQQLSAVWVVDFQGQRFVVSTDWLRSALGTVQSHGLLTPSDSFRIQSRLESLENDARALLAAPAVSPTTAQSVLDSILQRREFHHVHGPGWLQEAWGWVSDWVSSLLKRIFGRTGARIHLGALFLWGLIAAAGLALVVWLYHITLERPRQMALDLSGPMNIPKTWRDWLCEAAARAEARDYREGIHQAYWAAVCRLAELGAWRMDCTRTPREYVRLLKEVDAQREPLAIITRYFERIWYGERPASADDFQAVQSQLEKFGCL